MRFALCTKPLKLGRMTYDVPWFVNCVKITESSGGTICFVPSLVDGVRITGDSGLPFVMCLGVCLVKVMPEDWNVFDLLRADSRNINCVKITKDSGIPFMFAISGGSASDSGLERF